ncbi:MAG: cytochrome b N-terminal domain-containing protein [Nitrospirae bacterium]|nr:cytochrome b N-terminal domain-containing protein [Candidatus Troglogloeales bacterium]MBI3598420.1 cytochrome b N-terminal domain-containing protein [Candidatus Troglogloeales bacterium]
MKEIIAKIVKLITDNQVYRSVFRHGFPTTDANRALVMFSNVILHLHPVRVRRGALKIRFTWCLGGLTFFFFIMLAITGVFLMFYYVPDTRRAYNDIKDLGTVIYFGSLFRNMHRWAAHAMVLSVWMHMTRVFLTGSYKPPREFNWVVGVLLLVLTLVLSWTGYLLPWDQLALWAVTVGSKMAEATPLLGNAGPFGQEIGMTPANDVRFVLLGGTVVGQSALLRFYVLHCLGLPLVSAVLMAVHFWRIRKDGFSGPL